MAKIINTLLPYLFGGMIAYHAYFLARYRRPYRVAFLAFWGLLLYVHLARRDDLYPLILVCLIAAVVMRRREPANVARLMRRELARREQAGQGSRGTWDDDLDGPAPGPGKANSPGVGRSDDIIV